MVQEHYRLFHMHCATAASKFLLACNTLPSSLADPSLLPREIAPYARPRVWIGCATHFIRCSSRLISSFTLSHVPHRPSCSLAGPHVDQPKRPPRYPSPFLPQTTCSNAPVSRTPGVLRSSSWLQFNYWLHYVVASTFAGPAEPQSK
jgi:hypothetical protein